MPKKILLSLIFLLLIMGLTVGLLDYQFQQVCLNNGLKYQSISRGWPTYTLHNATLNHHFSESITIRWGNPIHIELHNPNIDLQFDDFSNDDTEKSKQGVKKSPIPLQIQVYNATIRLPSASLFEESVILGFRGEVHPDLLLKNDDMTIVKNDSQYQMEGYLPKNMQRWIHDDLEITCSTKIQATYTPKDGLNIFSEHIQINHPLLGREIIVDKIQSQISWDSNQLAIHSNIDNSELTIERPHHLEWKEASAKGFINIEDLFQWFATPIPNEWNITGGFQWNYNSQEEIPFHLQTQDLQFRGESDNITTLKFDQIPYMPIHATKIRLLGPSSPNWVNSNRLGWLPKALMAGEDVQFLTHKGLSNEGLSLAVMDVLNGSESPKGGSTITQQLAKNVFVGYDKTLARKIQELAYTLALEFHLNKEQISTLYLNAVEFGENIYGVKEASDLYFLKDPSQLSLKEAVFLIAILPNPAKGYRKALLGNPPQTRMNLILKNMKDAHWISTTQYQDAKNGKLQLLMPID